MKFESKIAAFLDTHLLFGWEAGTKQLIGCKLVMETVGNSGLNIRLPDYTNHYTERSNSDLKYSTYFLDGPLRIRGLCL